MKPKKTRYDEVMRQLGVSQAYKRLTRPKNFPKGGQQ